MSRRQALLFLDPSRWNEQVDYITARESILHWSGDRPWVALTDDQVSRFEAEGIGVTFPLNRSLVETPAVSFDPVTETPIPPPTFAAQPPTATERTYHIVHFAFPPDGDVLGPVLATGAVWVRGLCYDAAVLSVTEPERAAVAGLPLVDSVTPYHPAYALDYQLAGRDGAFGAADLSGFSVDAASVTADDVAGITIEFFDDVDAETHRTDVEATGAVISGSAINGLVIEPDAAVLPALLAVPGIYEIGVQERAEIGMDRARPIINADAINSLENRRFSFALEGNGELVGVIDTGLDTGNPATVPADLVGRVVGIVNTIPGGPAVAPDTDGHGTHVAGTIAGNGSLSSGRIRGVAPAAHVHAQGNLFDPAAENELVPHVRAIRNHVKVVNNSWGARRAGNRYRATNYDRLCYLYPEFLIIFISHNHERDVSGPGGAGPADGTLDMDQLTRQATSKNSLIVGAVESERDNDGDANTYRNGNGTNWQHAAFNGIADGSASGYTKSDSANQVALFSNRGTIKTAGGVDTLRVVPHIVAPGTNIIALKSTAAGPGGTTTVDGNIYTAKTGTSMAAPQVAGGAALCRQLYRTRFGQSRRPVILGSVPVAGSPPEDFVGFPAATRVGERKIFAWITPESSANPKQLVAAVHSVALVRLHQPDRALLAGVGDAGSPRLEADDTHLYVLHRHGDAELQLHRFDVDPAAATLTLDGAWNGSGHVVVTTSVDLGADRAPALLRFNDHLAVAWIESGQLNFRRYQVADGAAVDGAAVPLGAATTTSVHNYLAHDGTVYALAWLNGNDVEFRTVDNNGDAAGSDPVTVQSGGSARSAHLTWDNPRDRFVVIWDEPAAPGERLSARAVEPDGTLGADFFRPITTGAGGRVRRHYLSAHPDNGFVLVWEDDARQGQFGVYFTFLDAALSTDNRIAANPLDTLNRRIVPISDTPQDTSGVAAFTHSDGTEVAWNSLDEINADVLAVAALGIRPDGNFLAQTDPGTPLIRGGNYMSHQLAEHLIGGHDHVGIAWAGGDLYQIGWETDPDALVGTRIALLRTNADGLRDTTFAAAGSFAVTTDVFARPALAWIGNRLFCINSGTPVQIRAFDNLGRLADGTNVGIAEFGTAGVHSIDELAITAVPPLLAGIPGPPRRIIAVYGEGFVTPRVIRHTVVDDTATVIHAPVNLVSVASPADLGTAAHGWFHHVPGEARSTATWHERATPVAEYEVRIRQFDLNGTPRGAGGGGPGAPTISLLPRVAGDTWEALNATLAPRQQSITGAGVGPHEYAIVWQYRDAPANPYEIRFSRLNRDATVAATHNVQVVFPGMLAADGATVIWPPVAGTDTNAMEPLLVCTHTNEDHHPPPAVGAPAGNVWTQWSPGYGLGWVGQPVAGGQRSLYFTVLDENGARLALEPPPGGGPVTAGVLKVSSDDGDVQDFDIVWNGRTFRLCWTEFRDGKVRHMQTALTRHGSRSVYHQPSAALIRATLISGATNIVPTTLPNVPPSPSAPNNLTEGYGWGRMNLRQSFSPKPPVTMQVRDDAAVGNGRTATYRFQLQPGTQLLRITLAWTDPPGATVVHPLTLQVTASASGNVYRSNTWDTANGNPQLSQPNPPPIGGIPPVRQTVQQVVLAQPPAGGFVAEVIGHTVTATANNAFVAQPYALVFAGTGPEAIYGAAVCSRDFY